jgi:hypothetical protein
MKTGESREQRNEQCIHLIPVKPVASQSEGLATSAPTHPPSTRLGADRAYEVVRRLAGLVGEELRERVHEGDDRAGSTCARLRVKYSSANAAQVYLPGQAARRGHIRGMGE